MLDSRLSCPSRGVLANLLAEQLGADEQERLEMHLEGCSTCQANLLDLAGALDLHGVNDRPAFAAEPPAALLEAVQASILRDLSFTHPEDLGRLPIPGYEILEELGRGSGGIVFRARQIGLDRVVAIKILTDSPSMTPEDRLRALRGVQILAGFKHPNIVEIHAVGECKGFLYGVVELLENGSLARRLDGQPWDGREAAGLVRQVAEGLRAIHGRGVVHRDLKPGNILLGADGTAKIGDFGLARLVGRGGITQAGMVLGTARYMAPEQAAGRSAEAGPAADLFALGVVFFELLTGRLPLANEAALPLLGVPKELAVICRKCLQHAPEQRYARADDLLADLDRFLGQGTARESWWKRWFRW